MEALKAIMFPRRMFCSDVSTFLAFWSDTVTRQPARATIVPITSYLWTNCPFMTLYMTIRTPPMLLNIRTWLMMVYWPANVPQRDMQSPIKATTKIVLKVFQFRMSLNLNCLSKYVWTAAIIDRKGIMLSCRHESFRNGLLRGR